MSEMKEYKDAKLWQIGFFALNGASSNLYMAMMTYVSYYANSVAGIGVIIVSFLLTGLHVFDGVTDPVAGYILDKTNGRFGKFRPFMVLGNMLMGGSCLLIFFVTHRVPVYLRIPYFVAVYGVFIIGYTFQTVVSKSGQSALTNNPRLRPVSAYFDSLFVMASYGGLSLYVSVYLVGKYGGFQSAGLYKEMSITVIGLSVFCTLLAVAGIWEKDNKRYYQKHSKNPIKIRDYWDIIRENRPIRMLIIAACTDKFAATVYGHATVGVMLYGIIMRDYSIAGWIGVITAIPTLAVVTAGIRVAQKYGQKAAMVTFTLAAVVTQVPMMLILISDKASEIHFSIHGMNGITWLFFGTFVILNGCKSITNNMVTPMIADCTDYEVYRSGKYVPGLMGALFSFVDKTFAAAGTAFVGIVLALSGFEKALPQVGDKNTSLIKGITIFMYCVIPIAGWVCTLLSMRFYKLDKIKMQEINKGPGGQA